MTVQRWDQPRAASPGTADRPTGPDVGPTIREASTGSDWAQAEALLRDYAEWIRVTAGFDLLVEQPEFAAELGQLAGCYSGPERALLVALEGDVALGTVAVRLHADGTAELKRMYVRPDGRGRGVADQLVAAVLDVAAGQRCRLVWLESMPGAMDAAIALYRRHGFAAVTDPGRTIDLDGVLVMERPLALVGRCA